MKRIVAIFDDGLLTGYYSGDEALAILQGDAITTPTEPPPIGLPVVDPVKDFFGDLTLAGHRDNDPVYTGSKIGYYVPVYGRDPFTFAPKGTNFQFDALPGHTRLTGLDTAYDGQAAPGAFTKISGMRTLYFNHNVDEKYYQFSSEPDEVPTPIVITPTSTHSLSAQNFTGHALLLRPEN